MSPSEFYSLIKQRFPFEPTTKQDIVLQQLSEFIFDPSKNSLYLLKGFAGTGKTTIIGTIVNNLWKAKISAVLMAPTGRAAKVISNSLAKKLLQFIRKYTFLKRKKVVL